MGNTMKIAAIATIYHKYSHAQHIVDRFLEGYGWEARHHRPPMDLVSLYVDQCGDNDLSRDRAERPSAGFPLTLDLRRAPDYDAATATLAAAVHQGMQQQ